MNSKTLRSNTPFQLLLFLLLSMCCWGCTKTQVEKFTASDRHTYFELSDGKKLQRVYTEIQSNRMAVVVMDEANQPQLIKMTFPANAGQSTTILLEFSENKGTPSPGKKILDESFIRRLRAGDGQFEQWKKDYLAFPVSDPKFSKRHVITDKLGDNRDTIGFTDGNVVAFRLKNYFCACKNGRLFAVCLNSALRCAMDNLCDLWVNCIETGNWGPDCNANLDQAKVCLGEYEP